MKRKHPKLRACGRWMVWVCTALLVIGIPVSIWVGPMARVKFVPEPGSASQRRMVQVHCIDGALVGRYYPQYKQMYFSGPEPGWDVDFEQSTESWPVPVKWWRLSFNRGGGSGGTSFNAQLPLVYPATVMVAWSVWLMPFWKWWKRVGLDGVVCLSCEYSLAGLSGGVCPECGEAYEA
ncbi:MAG: hypothetical protein JKX70_00435 [Phycisphaerales bacterium]|nr:hypothetical protein [Phycisphaerales bacterium]